MLLGVLEVLVKGSSFRCSVTHTVTPASPAQRQPRQLACSTGVSSPAQQLNALCHRLCGCYPWQRKTSSFSWCGCIQEALWHGPWTLVRHAAVILAVCCAVLPRETLSLQGERDRNRRNPHNQGH